MNKYFTSRAELADHLEKKQQGHLLIRYSNLPDYAGMVLGIGIIFDLRKNKYELDVEWISFGLDLYAENLLENYLYKFESLEELLNYLESTYSISPSDIASNFKHDPDQFPNPIKNADEKAEFEAAWTKFQEDFSKGLFRDKSLNLVYSSQQKDEHEG